jgi:hypothetical protein
VQSSSWIITFFSEIIWIKVIELQKIGRLVAAAFQENFTQNPCGFWSELCSTSFTKLISNSSCFCCYCQISTSAVQEQWKNNQFSQNTKIPWPRALVE